MKIRWSPEAVTDLEEIGVYIARDKPAAGQEVINRIYARISEIPKFPHRARSGRLPGSRELSLSPLPYIVVYRVREDAIEISRIWHGAQSRRQ